MARHITGGELSYKFLSGSGSDNRYQITLKLYRDCFSNGAQLDLTAFITVYKKNAGGRGELFKTYEVPISTRNTLSLKDPGKCIDNPPRVCYEVGIYTIEVDLPAETYGYSIAYQRCCRIENISNVSGSGQVGATYSADVPGTNISVQAPVNSSPLFAAKDTTVVCEDNYFLYDFSSTDVDGDSLSYTFCAAYRGGSNNDPQPQVASPPPFNPLPYSFGFGASSPMGANVTIDSKTGIVSGIAPAAGMYVMTVCVNEFRKGVLINVHRKDIQIKVAACTIAGAALDPVYMSCDGFTLSLQNKSNSNLIKTYYWDFGVNGITDDTSTVARPTYTYTDTGTYKITLITNRNEECSDTAFTLAKVYPGFFPGFIFSEGCKDVPIYFTDTTKTRFGVVDSWKWNFGVTASDTDVSSLPNPAYTFSDAGTYNVALTVTNSKGCEKTTFADIVVRTRPLLSVPHDTLMCNIDTISLTATGPPGTYTWMPNYNISTLTGNTVSVSPDMTTTYTVNLTTVPGCTSTDSIRVNVVSFVTLDAGADITMCLTDTLQLMPFSDGLRYEWTPGETLNNTQVKSPFASPVNQSTIYSVTAYIGKCFASDNIRVTAIPYPDVRTISDTSICYGEAVQLFAEGGAFYTWSPTIAINNFNAPNPVVNPAITTTYTVSVFDTLGCPKPTIKAVLVRVIPPVPAYAGNDTAVVLEQPLQLQASGAEFYKWSPPQYLSDTVISNPVANFKAEAGDYHTYIVKVSTPEGCFAYDTVNVRLFRTQPDIFVADTFTPNGDYLNDVFHVYPVGIKQLDYFRVFNRWGQLLFSSNSSENGWDGTFRGKEQSSDNYVWVASGTDYLGRKIIKKGTLMLMR